MEWATVAGTRTARRRKATARTRPAASASPPDVAPQAAEGRYAGSHPGRRNPLAGWPGSPSGRSSEGGPSGRTADAGSNTCPAPRRTALARPRLRTGQSMNPEETSAEFARIRPGGTRRPETPGRDGGCPARGSFGWDRRYACLPRHTGPLPCLCGHWSFSAEDGSDLLSADAVQVKMNDPRGCSGHAIARGCCTGSGRVATRTSSRGGDGRCGPRPLVAMAQAVGGEGHKTSGPCRKYYYSNDE